MRTGTVLAARLTIVMFVALVTAAVSLAVTAAVFAPHQWPVYAAANVLIGATYALVGVLLGPIFGRVSGVFIAFLAPFLDLGIAQSPMLRAEPPTWAEYLPGYGGMRLMLDGGLTDGFDETRGLLTALAWLAALTLAAAVLHRRTAGPTSGTADHPHDAPSTPRPRRYRRSSVRNPPTSARSDSASCESPSLDG
jgi:hypothetical protein